jgi:chaperonin cofactor prefoldin
MAVFTKEGDRLVSTRDVAKKYTRKDLENEQDRLEEHKARIEAEIAEVKTLLAECDKLGL